jgi:hypothetical protein
MKPLNKMTPSEINKALDKIDELQSKNNQAFIDAGRGLEKPSDFWNKSDPLSTEYRMLSEKKSELQREIYRRVGSGFSRMPNLRLRRR